MKKKLYSKWTFTVGEIGHTSVKIKDFGISSDNLKAWCYCAVLKHLGLLKLVQYQ